MFFVDSQNADYHGGNALHLIRFGILHSVLEWMTTLMKELVRRGVLRALGAYIVIIWLLAQGLVDLLPAVGMPEWSTLR